MKLALLFLALVSTLAGHQVGAQYASQGVPACGTSCIEIAASTGKCAFVDTTCICAEALRDPAVASKARNCLAQACSGLDANKTLDQFCAHP